MQKSDPVTGRAIVEVARSWLLTPYVHQHRLKGAGVDCVGLVIGVGLEAGILPTWSEEAWAPHQGYGRAPNPEHMTRAIRQFMDPAAVDPRDPAPDGCVGFFGWRQHMPMHLAIMGTAPDGRRTMIHAFSGVGLVVEHGFDAEWPGRVVSWWRYPGAEG